MAETEDFVGQEPHPGNIPIISPADINRTIYRDIIKGKCVQTLFLALYSEAAFSPFNSE